MTFTAFWVQHRLWGDATLGYHLVNILLHCLSALLFLSILRRLEVPGAWLAAAIFALHPVHVESVAWMTQLKNTLSGVFYLSSVLTYLGFDRTRGKVSYALALGLFALGLLSKTAIVTMPAAMLVIFWWKRGRLSWRRDALPLAPFFLAALAAGWLTAWLEQSMFGARGAEFQFSFLQRCLIAGRAIWFHLGKLLWPAELLFIYPRWQISQTAWAQYIYPAAALVLLAALWRLRHWSRAPLAALLCFIGTLFPALGFFNAYTFRFTFVNDHHQYLASLGVIALVSAAATVGSARGLFCRSPYCPRSIRGALCLMLLATLATLTWRQCRMYADLGTLWRTTLAKNPDCYAGHSDLGTVLVDEGHLEEAMARYRRALQLCPDYPEALVNLGNAFVQKAQWDEAIACYRKALQVEPRNAKIHSNLANAFFRQGKLDAAIEALNKALALAPRFPGAHSNLGLVLLQKGQLDEAIHQFQQALQYQPDFTVARKALGTALGQNGRVEEAIAQLTQVVLANPSDSATHCELAGMLGSRGRTKDAIAHYRAALRAKPEFPEALNNLAWILAANADPQMRNGPEAVILAERACRLTDAKQALMVGTLAAAYAEAGRFTEAVSTAEKAARLAEQAKEPELATKNRKLLELYRAGQPYHEPAVSPARP